MSNKDIWAKLSEPAGSLEEYKPTKLVFYCLGHRPFDYGNLYLSDGAQEKCYQYSDIYSVIPFVPSILRKIDCERVARLLQLPLEVQEGPKK